MLLKNILGILIILFNAAGLGYLGYIGVKKALNSFRETQGKSSVIKKEPGRKQTDEKEDFNETDFQKDDDLIDDFDLTDFDDLDLDDLD
ncbi:MAG: hypothetical protein ACQETC_03940 [Thermodesulfobacteriota bacterium]